MTSLRKRVTSYFRQLSFHNEPREKRHNINENSFINKYLTGQVKLKDGPPVLYGKTPNDLPNFELGSYATGTEFISGCSTGPNGGLTTVKRVEKHLSIPDADIDFIDTQDETAEQKQYKYSPTPLIRNSNNKRSNNTVIDNSSQMKIKVAGQTYIVSNNLKNNKSANRKSRSLGSLQDLTCIDDDIIDNTGDTAASNVHVKTAPEITTTTTNANSPFGSNNACSNNVIINNTSTHVCIATNINNNINDNDCKNKNTVNDCVAVKQVSDKYQNNANCCEVSNGTTDTDNNKKQTVCDDMNIAVVVVDNENSNTKKTIPNVTKEISIYSNGDKICKNDKVEERQHQHPNSSSKVNSSEGINKNFALSKSKSAGSALDSNRKKKGKIIRLTERPGGQGSQDSSTVSNSQSQNDSSSEKLPTQWNRKTDLVYGLSDSLYDMNQVTKVKNGSPIADCFGIIARNDSAILALADGVNWGEKACIAAKSAIHGCLYYLSKTLFEDTSLFDLDADANKSSNVFHDFSKENSPINTAFALNSPKSPENRISNTNEVFVSLLRAFNCAHNLILENEGMLTTLTVAVVLPLKSSNYKRPTTTLESPQINAQNRGVQGSSQKYICCVCNVGDTLAYVYSPRYGVREITKGSHDIHSNRDMRDALGALGPVDGINPELNNLTLSVTTLDAGDIVMIASDGLTDNYDPTVCKFTVNQISSESTTAKHSKVVGSATGGAKERHVTSRSSRTSATTTTTTTTTTATTNKNNTHLPVSGSRQSLTSNNNNNNNQSTNLSSSITTTSSSSSSSTTTVTISSTSLATPRVTPSNVSRLAKESSIKHGGITKTSSDPTSGPSAKHQRHNTNRNVHQERSGEITSSSSTPLKTISTASMDHHPAATDLVDCSNPLIAQFIIDNGVDPSKTPSTLTITSTTTTSSGSDVVDNAHIPSHHSSHHHHSHQHHQHHHSTATKLTDKPPLKKPPTPSIHHDTNESKHSSAAKHLASKHDEKKSMHQKSYRRVVSMVNPKTDQLLSSATDKENKSSRTLLNPLAKSSSTSRVLKLSKTNSMNTQQLYTTSAASPSPGAAATAGSHLKMGFLRSKTSIDFHSSAAAAVAVVPKPMPILRNEDGLPYVSPVQKYELQLLLMEDILLRGITGKERPCVTAKILCENLLRYTISITAAKRRSLEDKELYFDNKNDVWVEVSAREKKIRRRKCLERIQNLPGKLDHVSVVAYNVGNTVYSEQ